MSKKQKQIVIILLMTVLIVGGVLFFLFRGGTSTTPADKGKELSFFGFLNTPDTTSSTGSTGTGTGGDEGGTGTTPSPEEPEQKFPVLRVISDKSVAGAVSFIKTIQTDEELGLEEDRIFVRYIESGTGHVYEVDVSTMEKKRVSNTTIPKIHEAFFSTDGEQIIIRYFDEEVKKIKSFSADIVYDPDTGEGELSGEFLVDDIVSLNTLDGEKIFYLEGGESNTSGIVADFDGTNKKQIFNSVFTEWLSQTAGDIYFTTKASASALGFLYSTDIKGKSFQKVFGNVLGLTTLLSPDEKQVLYSESTKNGFTLNIYDREEASSRRVPLTTLPEKCAWSKDSIKIYCAVSYQIKTGDYPDDWYKGLMSFMDSVWSFNIDTRVMESLTDEIDDTGVNKDMTHLFLDQNEEYLFFTNKTDGRLWLLELGRE